MTEELLVRGLDLLLYGMGTVIVFLSLLVGLTTVMSRVITTHFPEPEPAIQPAPGEPDMPVSALTLRILQAAVDRRRTLAGQFKGK